jgi:SAM-dependent methyltransferase
VRGDHKLREGDRFDRSSGIRQACARILKDILPVSALQLVARFRKRAYCPPPGHVRLGDLRRQTPFSRDFGFDRGLPIDRYYIEGFLSDHAADIQGRVLEIGGNTYTRKFGADRITKSDVLHVSKSNPTATIVADITSADHIPSDCFDCVILTQTLQYIYDVPAALRTLRRILKPGGVSLATLPGISQIPRGYWEATWYWAFTTASARRLFEEVFPPSSVAVKAHGNVLASVAFLEGLAMEELDRRELDFFDPDYQTLITVRAVKAEVPA